MINIPCISEEVAESFSRKIFNLMMPEHLRDNNYTTLYYCAFEKFSNVWYLRIPENLTVSIHNQANLNELDSIISSLINSHQVPTSLLEEVRTKINSSKGQHINVSDLVPEFWLAIAVPDNQLIS